MKMYGTPHMPSIDLWNGYALHDRDGFIEFATGMWLHTRELVGPPTIAEVRATLREFPQERQDEVILLLDRHGQINPVDVTFEDLARIASVPMLRERLARATQGIA